MGLNVHYIHFFFFHPTFIEQLSYAQQCLDNSNPETNFYGSFRIQEREDIKGMKDSSLMEFRSLCGLRIAEVWE